MIFNSLRYMIVALFGIIVLTAILFWLYLNVQASMSVTAQRSKIQLSKDLPTKISVGNYLETRVKGDVDTQINVDRTLNLPLHGKYLANLRFIATTPVNIDVDYQTKIKVSTLMPLETTTDLIYQKKFLPKFPLKLNVPIQLDVPFHLKKSYQIPIQIEFNGPVILELNESIDLSIKHQFKPKLKLDDEISVQKIADFNATMYNTSRETTADLKMNIDLPIRYIHP